MSSESGRRTAKAVVDALEPGDLFSAEFREEVVRRDGKRYLIPDSVRLLRRAGEPLYATRAGKNSKWFRRADPKQYGQADQRSLGDYFSYLIDQIRSSDGMAGVSKVRLAQMERAIPLGIELGMERDSIVAKFEPVPLDFDLFPEEV